MIKRLYLLSEQNVYSFLHFARLAPPSNVLEKIDPHIRARVDECFINAETVQIHEDKVLGEGNVIIVSVLATLTEMLRTPNLTQPGFEPMTSRSLTVHSIPLRFSS